jgi:isoleucyl-tRNA synthetase
MKEKPSYKVNLPVTAFPMKANSTVREVEIQKFWDDKQIYERNLANRSANAKYVLHDGPPYLSSDKIHIGHALNKILKDIITKYKALKGFYSPFVPGYDSHGLPIENAVLKDVKGGRSALTPVALRQKCREFALANLKGQQENFRRLGVWANWAQPYITLDQHFEAKQLRVFGKMASKGFLYKGLKPVQWCPNCETALAEAEVEYADHISHSIYVKFAFADSSRAKLPGFVPADKACSLVIWTTTPWTLPANLAVALNPEFVYDFYLWQGREVIVIASALRELYLKETETNPEDLQLLGQVKGRELELLECRHPFLDRLSKVILGEHVTTEAGTGCVHTAPGHGPDDFIVGKTYNLGVLSPVDGRGIFTEEGGPFVGQRFDKANPAVVELLAQKEVLVKHLKFSHSYPHCWRCKKPLIFRATEQWFASVDGFRQAALDCIDKVEWLPASGRNRIYKMVENRSDWCISRQRAWGVPIPVFYCRKCNEPLLSEESVNKVADVFDEKGSDSWWELEAKDLIGDIKCAKCAGAEFEREQDIMDVWFDSGSTHAAVLDARAEELRGTPCELYLEGSDQHRGWFQSSLLTSVAVNGCAPYKTVLTHGFVMDENGRKMSKSLGNVVGPAEVIKEYGADVLRLWVASVNYTDDIPIGKNMLKQLADVYRKLRNTARYMLGNLYDFDPAAHLVPVEKMLPIDRFILHRLNLLVEEISQDFDCFEFFKYYQLLQNFCGVELSSFYFDIIKDRLYTLGADSHSRRSAQTALVYLLHAVARVLVPVTPHLSEDIWQHLSEPVRKFYGNDESVLLTDYPEVKQEFHLGEEAESWNDLKGVRETVYKALEQARAQGKIGSSLEAKVLLSIDEATLAGKVEALGDDLSSFFITSQAHVGKNGNKPGTEYLSTLSENGMTVYVSRAEGVKCGRCWKYQDTVGKDESFAELCQVCAEVEGSLKASI